MFYARLQLKQVNYIYEADLQVGEPFSEQYCRSQRFLCWNVARCSHDNVRVLICIITGPFPDAYAFCAVSNGSVNIQILQVPLLVRDNNIDVVFGSQAVIRYGQ